MASRTAAIAASPAATARCFESSSSAPSDRTELGLGLRLCLRRLRQWTKAQVPHRWANQYLQIKSRFNTSALRLTRRVFAIFFGWLSANGNEVAFSTTDHTSGACRANGVHEPLAERDANGGSSASVAKKKVNQLASWLESNGEDGAAANLRKGAHGVVAPPRTRSAARSRRPTPSRT